MTAKEIAEKYVYGRHNALTDNQEIIDMTEDINNLIKDILSQSCSYKDGKYECEGYFVTSDELINKTL